MAKGSKTSITPKARSRRGGVNSPVLGSVNPYGFITQKQLDASLALVKSMTHAELVESLKTSGVLTPSGKLAKRYRS